MKKYVSLILIIFGIACSPYKNNPLSGSYHNLTAHYNSYFIAKERIKEIEQTIFESQEWNYNKVLPIYPQFDTTMSASMEKEIEDCIQKASISIQRHPGSKWEDDSYILVGKARHYASEFPDAIETYKYVNTHSKDDNARHYALTELMRSFTEFKEYRNAIAVTDYLAKEELNKENMRRMYMNTAYLYQQYGDDDKMVGALIKAEELLNSPDKARINFIIGQTYHLLGFESEAFNYYKNVLKNRPSYELEFYAKLYMAQVSKLSRENDLKKIEKYFKRLIKDPKNKDYLDKIYYELAKFKLKNGRLQEAILHYKNSVQNSTENQRQKGLSYLGLGQIYYDSIKNYVLAQSYYDSTVAVMPKDEDNYEVIKERQEILKDFVTQIVTIQKNDSLLHLVSLPEDSVLSIISKQIEQERKEAEEKKKKEKRAALNRARNITNQTGDNLIATATTGAVWYFDNSNARSKGSNDFKRKWGERPLEDNWRRENKEVATGSNPPDAAVGIEEKGAPQVGVADAEELPVSEEATQQMNTLPYSDDQKKALLGEIEIALYNLGNIYNLRLEEDENAIDSFEELLSRFPDTAYEPEVLYQLYLLHKKLASDEYSVYGQMLKSKYPETIYAKLVDNPNYREESFAVSSRLKQLYKSLYGKYKRGLSQEVIYQTDSALALHPDNEFSDNVALLRALAIGKTSESHKYQYELSEFEKKYPESELLEYAQSLLDRSKTFQQERYNSGKARFIEDFNQKHTLIIVYDIASGLATDLLNDIDQYLEENDYANLKTANLILSEEKSMILVNSFSGKKSAERFLKDYLSAVPLKQKYKGQKIDTFVITSDNFDILYRTKDLSTYKIFFLKHYP